jgi:hypothetical protein
VVVALASVLLVAAGVGCTSSDRGAEPEAAPGLTLPPPTFDDVPVVTLPEGFVMPDTRGARLLPVVARPRSGPPPIPVFGGTAALRGRVEGPDGPVAGATVLLERFVGERSGRAEVTAGADGRWSASNVHGGRYRLRAWLPPSLTATESEVVFVAAGASADVVIRVSVFDDLQLQAALDVSVVSVGDEANVRALLSRETVGPDGIVSGAPVGGRELNLGGDGGFVVVGANQATTGGDGTASWRVRCDREGAHRLTVTGEDVSSVVSVPACAPRAAEAPPPVVIPDFPVGEAFTVPRAAILPPGTYRTSDEGCAFTYEVYENGSWQPARRLAQGQVVVLSNPARDLRPAAGSDGCRYERTA